MWGIIENLVLKLIIYGEIKTTDVELTSVVFIWISQCLSD